MFKAPDDETLLKSAEPIESGKLVDRLLAADVEVRKTNPASQTTIAVDGDRPRVTKAIGGSLGGPMPPPADLALMAQEKGIPWRPEYSDRVVPFWASDQRVDRHGDIVKQNFDFSEYAHNPVVPFSHDWDMPPVGNAIDWKVLERKDADYEGPALRLLDLFASKETWEWADTVFRLVKAGFLRTSSIGFYPKKVWDIKDPAARKTLGLGPNGLVLDENVLLEHSPTTIPANPGTYAAFAHAKSKGLLQPNDVQCLREMRRRSIVAGPDDRHEWLRSEATLLAVWRTLFPEVHTQVHREFDVPLFLEAFSEDQARDPDGKWGSGGVGETGASGAPARDQTGTQNPNHPERDMEGVWIAGETSEGKLAEQAKTPKEHRQARSYHRAAAFTANKMDMQDSRDAHREAGKLHDAAATNPDKGYDVKAREASVKAHEISKKTMTKKLNPWDLADLIINFQVEVGEELVAIRQGVADLRQKAEDDANQREKEEKLSSEETSSLTGDGVHRALAATEKALGR